MAKQIHQGAHANAADLLVYEITGLMITDLFDAIEEFVEYIGKPRAAKADTSAATSQLVQGFELADKILKEQLDKGIELYRFSQVDFYDAYQNARIIVNSPTIKRALDIHVQDSVTNLALKHIKITIDTVIHKRTSSLGNVRQQNLAEGAHTCTAALPGYVLQNQNFNTITGETTKLIILLVKV